MVHVGEMLARVGGTKVYAAGFASIQSLRGQSLKSEGFERQATLLEAVRAREKELLVCNQATMSFDAVTEGGCGHDAIALTFGDDGRLKTVSSVEPTECPQHGAAPSNKWMQLTSARPDGGARS
jgi:hypothetical protein